MTNHTDPLAPLTLAIADYAHALATQSDSSIDDAQLIPDALLALIDDDYRADCAADDAPLPDAIDRASLDSLDADRYDALNRAYHALLDARP